MGPHYEHAVARTRRDSECPGPQEAITGHSAEGTLL